MPTIKYYLLIRRFTMKMIKTFTLITLLTVILGLSLRGNNGSPDENQLNSIEWKEDGPFELSPERGRFILTYSILENHSFQFTGALAKFGSPDVAVTDDGKFASLFAPTVSFITMPGYIIGKYFGASQFGTYSVISLFAVFNLFLIRSIAKKMGADSTSSTIAAIIFLFATPAFAYAVNLYQHHISTFLILSSLYLLIRFKGFWSLLGIFFLYSLSITVDYPNLFLMFPIVLIAFAKILRVGNYKEKINITIKTSYLITSVSIILPMVFLLWFNKVSFGNPFQLSGTLKTVRDFSEFSNLQGDGIQGLQPTYLKKEKEDIKHKKTAIGFFDTRNLTNGFYLHFLSPDRGILFFSPVILLSAIGIVIAYKKKIAQTSIFLGVLGTNILLYSMWGDPWGGWAFGSRYLITSYATSAIFLALAINRFRENLFFLAVFFCLFIYSTAVNTLGAITTSANPPKIEALPLEELSGKQQKYTFERNIDYLSNSGSKSFIYRTYAKNFLTPWQYYYLVLAIILISSSTLLISLAVTSRRKNV